jgi:hypothetical protein
MKELNQSCLQRRHVYIGKVTVYQSKITNFPWQSQFMGFQGWDKIWRKPMKNEGV